jgi:seryl-tRNA synthetase
MNSVTAKFVAENPNYALLLCISKNSWFTELDTIPYLVRWIKWSNQNIQRWTARQKSCTDPAEKREWGLLIRDEKKDLRDFQKQLDEAMLKMPNDMADDVPVKRELSWGQVKARFLDKPLALYDLL